MRERPVILAVDDEPHLLRFLSANLQLAGYEVVVAADAPQALQQIAAHQPDLMLLDLGIPGMDGFALLEQVRGFSDMPVIILTALDSEDDKVRGLSMGADDYLTKPFGSRELQARIAAVLRRAHPSGEVRAPAFRSGDLLIDFANRRVYMQDTQIHLTPTEYRLICHFAEHAGRVLSHEHLLAHVWGMEYRDDVYVLRAAVWRLRQKIEPDPSQPTYIVSEPGVGYRLVRH